MESKFCPICKKGQLNEAGYFIKCSNCAFGYQNPDYDKNESWAKRKSWAFPTILLLFLLYTSIRYIFDYDYPVARFENPISYLDLGIHEVGHILFSFMGEFMSTLGGSLFQLLVPIIAIVGLKKEGYLFASSASYIWLGLNFYDVGTYVADASSRLLPLVSIGGGDYESLHDWYQILSRGNNLDLDNEIALTLRVIGFIVIIIGFYLSSRLILKIKTTNTTYKH